MTKMKKKYTRGEATTFVSRKQALKRLQLTLNDFRRLCIMKGVYPQEPVNRRRVGKGSSTPKVYYHLKDIQFLGHEKVMQKLRDIKAHLKKAKRAKERGEMETVERLQRNFPAYTLDHIIRERYPTFDDAVRDLDDCLCLCFLFARLPKERGVPIEQIRLSARLTVQFLHWVMAARALRKAFVSIKGYYFEADVNGIPVVWSLPHQLGLHDPADVDFKVLRTFNEFYTTMLGFVNYRLYNGLGLAYPPALANEVESSDYCQGVEAHEEFMASLNQPLLSRRGDADEKSDEAGEGNPAEPDDFPETEADGAEAASAARKKARAQQRLFSGCRFFLNRETPRQILCFVIRSCGGEVSWSPLSGPGSRYPESDQRITHQLVDRPLGDQRLAGRAYVQPQWLFDCLNAGELLPTGEYAPGLPPPPHLSPFVASSAADDDSEQLRQRLPFSATQPADPVELRRPTAAAERGEDDEDDEKVEKHKQQQQQQQKTKAKPKPPVVAEGVQRRPKDAAQTAAEERRLREMMLPKKHKQLYSKMVFSRKRQAREAAQLVEKKQKRQRVA